MKILLEYLAGRKKTAFVFLLFLVIQWISFSLFQIPVSVIVYSAAICGVIGLGVVSWDFYVFVKKHRRMKRLVEKKIYDMELLPEPDSLMEKDYRKLVHLLLSEKSCLETEKDTLYVDMIEYYTLWMHQIKTPIASMRLMLQGEEDDLNRGLKMELLEIEQYVEMVLCYLRLDSESTDYVIRKSDLDAMVKPEVKKLAPQFIKKKIKLEYEELHRSVLTDEKWLSFVVGQVLSNAVKYTKRGRVAITWEEPEVLCICDTGIGIAPEDLPRIFEKGYTGFNGRMDKKASGIGLYLCKKICDNLGHGISVESVVGKGTTVKIQLGYRQMEVE